jgi:hypothetical protein
MDQADSLDFYLPEGVRAWIEQTYYARINRQAQLDAALRDPEFRRDPAPHVALFNDRGCGSGNRCYPRSCEWEGEAHARTNSNAAYRTEERT